MCDVTMFVPRAFLKNALNTNAQVHVWDNLKEFGFYRVHLEKAHFKLPKVTNIEPELYLKHSSKFWT